MSHPAQHYTGERGRAYHEGKRAIPAAALPWVARLRAEKISPHVRPADAVFEYGVGSGWNLASLACARKIGFDLSDFLAPDLAALGIEFCRDPREMPDASADVVLCHHTLEHVPDPLRVLGELQRLAKPGGKILLFVPFEKERRYRRFDPAEPNHHLFSWNVQTLGNLVAESGLRVERAGLGCFGYDRFAGRQSVRFHLGEAGFRAIRRFAHLIFPAREVRVIARRA